MSVSSKRLWRRAGVFTLGLAAACAGTIAVLDLYVVGRAHHVAVARVAKGAPAMAVLADEWGERIQRETSWGAARRWSPNSSPRNQPSRLQGPMPPPGWAAGPPRGNSWFWDDDDDEMPLREAPRVSSGYRTVCVRTCDGFFFPIGHGVSESRFSSDQATCNSTCPGAKLFYYRPGSQDPDDMVDLSGQKYSRMPNANLFRTQFVASCRCKPNPWDQESVDRHRIYALEDQRKKGNRSVQAELETLRTKYRLEAVASARRRQSDRNRTSAAQEISASQMQHAAAALEVAPPRSDASRGQGGSPLPGATGSVLAVTPAATVGTTTVVEAAASTSVAAPTIAKAADVPAEPIPVRSTVPEILAAPSVEPAEGPVAAVTAEPAPTAAPEAQPDPIAEAEQPAKPGRNARRQRTAAKDAGASRESRQGSGDWVRRAFSQ